MKIENKFPRTNHNKQGRNPFQHGLRSRGEGYEIDAFEGHMNFVLRSQVIRDRAKENAFSVVASGISLTPIDVMPVLWLTHYHQLMKS